MERVGGGHGRGRGDDPGEGGGWGRGRPEGPGEGPQGSGGIRNEGGRGPGPKTDGQDPCRECRGLPARVPWLGSPSPGLVWPPRAAARSRRPEKGPGRPGPRRLPTCAEHAAIAVPSFTVPGRAAGSPPCCSPRSPGPAPSAAPRDRGRRRFCRCHFTR